MKFFGCLCDFFCNRHSVENSLCSGFTIYAKHISVNLFAGRTFVIRSRISSPLLTFTYRDFKLRLLSRLHISHNPQRPCYETITVFDSCGTIMCCGGFAPTVCLITARLPLVRFLTAIGVEPIYRERSFSNTAYNTSSILCLQGLCRVINLWHSPICKTTHRL